MNCNHQRVADSGTMSHVIYDDSSHLGGESRAVNSSILDMTLSLIWVLGSVCNKIFVVASF